MATGVSMLMLLTTIEIIESLFRWCRILAVTMFSLSGLATAHPQTKSANCAEEEPVCETHHLSA